MAKGLDNCLYNKIKLLHELSEILWFIKKHGVQDAKRAGDQECMILCDEIESDLEEHINSLRENLNIK